MNIAKTFFNGCNPDKAAYIIDDEVVTYKILKKRTEQYRYYFKKHNPQPKNVLIFLPESLDFVASILACWSLGIATYHPSISLPDSVIRSMVKNANTGLVISNSEMAKKLNVDCDIIYIDNIELVNEDNIYDDQTPDTEIFYGITTGSTGTPKMVVHTINNLLKWAEIYSDQLGINDKTMMYTTSRISFNWGVSCAVTMNLFKKSTCVLNSRIATPKLIKHNIETHKPTHFFTVPLFIDLLVKSKLDVNFNHVDYSMSSGDWLPEHLCTQFEQKFKKQLLNGLGSSETVSNYTFIAECDQENVNSMGKIIPDVEMKIMKNGERCDTGEIGEIYVSSPWFSKTYLNFVDNTTYENGWIKTKDLAYLNKNGCLVYMGRKNSIFKINGEFVNPIEIEKHILEFNGITNCIVKPSNFNEGVPKLSVDILCDNEIDIEQLKSFLKGRLEKNRIPKIYNFVNEMNRTWNGKIRRAVLDAH